MNTRRLDVVLAGLLLATGLTWWLGERHAAGPGAAGLMLLIAALKGLAVMREFMALRGVRPLWQGLVGGWLLAVLGAVAATYLWSMP